MISSTWLLVLKYYMYLEQQHIFIFMGESSGAGCQDPYPLEFFFNVHSKKPKICLRQPPTPENLNKLWTNHSPPQPTHPFWKKKFLNRMILYQNDVKQPLIYMYILRQN